MSVQLTHQDKEQIRIQRNKPEILDDEIQKYIDHNKQWADFISLHIQDGDTILDIGSGLGILDVFLSRKFPNSKFYLLDCSEKSKTTGKNSLYNDHVDDYSIRINLEQTSNFLIRNGLKSDKFKCLDYSKINLNHLDISVDVILSKKSWCFHYPYDTYNQWARKILKPNGIMIIDVRYGQVGTLLANDPDLKLELIRNEIGKCKTLLARFPTQITDDHICPQDEPHPTTDWSTLPDRESPPPPPSDE